MIDKVIKILRLARAAGSDAEAHTALTLAQRLMYAHGIADHELDADPGGVEPIEDRIVDEAGHRVPWKEYLAAVIAENFRCACIISSSRASGSVRLVFVGRQSDAAVAAEAYQASAIVAAHLATQCAATRAPGEQADARASFLTGFLKGLVDRFDESMAETALMVVASGAVLEHAAQFVNAPAPDGSEPGRLPVQDQGALREGFESGYAHASGQRRLGPPRES